MRILIFISFLLPLYGVFGQADAQTPLKPMDIFDLQMAHSPAIQPEGNSVAYLRQRFDIKKDKARQQVWMVNANGGNHRAISDLRHSYRGLSWSPDGSQLAFLHSEDGKHYLHIYNVETAHQNLVAEFSESPGGLIWSPGGEQLAFQLFVEEKQPSIIAGLPSPPEGADWAPAPTVITKTRYRSDGRKGFVPHGHKQLFVMNADGGAPRQLTTEPYDHSRPFWKADGKHLVFTAQKDHNIERVPRKAQIYRMDLATIKTEKVTQSPMHFRLQDVNEKGEYLCIAFEDKELGYQKNHLYVVDGNSGKLKKVDWERDRQAEAARWAASDEAIVVKYTDHGLGALDLVHMEGGKRQLVKDLGGTSFGRPYAGGDFDLAASGDLVYTRSSPYKPADLAIVSTESGKSPIALTDCNAMVLKDIDLGQVEKITFPSSHDQQSLEGWIIYPPDYKKEQRYPMILEIHGGPYAAYGPHFTAELQLMAASGYVVLYMNPRGSTSYGADFASSINNNYPSEDYDDLMSGVETLVDRGIADPENLFITGGSGGGVLTAWSIGKTDRFRAAVVAKPVINWYSFMLTADAYPSFVRNWFDEAPWENPMSYLDRSPISLVGNVQTPTLLMTGEQDYRTPMSETEQYYGALRIQGVESALVRIPGSSHGIAKRPSNLLRKTAVILSWFDSHRE